MVAISIGKLFGISDKDWKRLFRILLRAVRTTLQAFVGTSAVSVVGAPQGFDPAITIPLALAAGLAALVQNSVEELKRVDGIWSKELDDPAPAI